MGSGQFADGDAAAEQVAIFLQTKEDENDHCESSQFSVLIVNASGIYGLYSYREVFEFNEFWGIGSGRGFALGAMHAMWGSAKTARELATIGVNAGCEFDKNSAGPVEVFTVKLNPSLSHGTTNMN